MFTDLIMQNAFGFTAVISLWASQNNLLDDQNDSDKSDNKSKN